VADFTDPQALARRTRERARSLKRGMDGATLDQATLAKSEAVALTSGPRRARNAPSPVSPVLPIGQRTRKLVRGWRVIRTRGGRALVNLAPHHVFVLAPGGTRRTVTNPDGTKRRSGRHLMRPRRLWEALRLRTARPMTAISARAQARALQG